MFVYRPIIEIQFKDRQKQKYFAPYITLNKDLSDTRLINFEKHAKFLYWSTYIVQDEDLIDEFEWESMVINIRYKKLHFNPFRDILNKIKKLFNRES